jgi:guanylate kinase
VNKFKMCNSNLETLGTLYIISSPSGGGKTSLVNALIESNTRLETSISHTTRPPRPGEKDGIDYYFVTHEHFLKKINRGIFLEYANVFGYYYGSSRPWIEDKIQQGIDVILEIDWQGAQQIRKIMPEIISIFILPPAWNILKTRLQKRGQDKEDTINTRMNNAQREIAHYHEYDYLIVNDNFTKALSDLNAIIRVQRLRTAVQKKELDRLLKKLLEQSI